MIECVTTLWGCEEDKDGITAAVAAVAAAAVAAAAGADSATNDQKNVRLPPYILTPEGDGHNIKCRRLHNSPQRATVTL
jgi:hypothetical protein